MLLFSNHRGRMDKTGRQAHPLRDWSGASIPGNILYPPVEMLYAASYLRERGHTVGLVDGNAGHLSMAQSLDRIEAMRPEAVVSVSGWFTEQHDLAFFREIKKRLPDCITIMAGPNVTLDPSIALKVPEVDFVAMGEFMDGLDEILSGRLSKNVALREGSNIAVRPTVPIVPLDKIPFAAWDLIDPSKYWAPFVRNYPFALARTSVGCPHAQCRFCHQVSYFGQNHRSHSTRHVMEEADYLMALGFQEIIYRDQAFTARRDVVEALCCHLISLGRPLTWRVSTRVDLVDPDLLALMKDAGCYQISLGFESFSDKALGRCEKGVTVRQGDDAARWTRQVGMEISGGFILGLPGEELRSAGQWLRLIRRRGIDFPQFFLFEFAYDRDQRRFYPVEKSETERKREQKLLRHLILRFYLNPHYLLRQLHRVFKNNGITHLPGFLLDFFRYFL